MIEWCADGEYHQIWYDTKLGIELDMVEKALADKTIDMITTTPPCKLRTNR